MTRFSQFITSLQNQPYQTRLKILWIGVATVAVILIIVWVFDLKSTIQGLEGNSLISLNPTNQTSSEASTVEVASIESVERTNENFKIYFNIKNNTTDILNFSQKTDISLRVGSQTLTPKQVVDRQGNLFVQKILSNTQNFGILIFEPIPEDAVEGELTFNNLMFEQATDKNLKQQINLNFEELSKPAEVRN